MTRLIRALSVLIRAILLTPIILCLAFAWLVAAALAMIGNLLRLTRKSDASGMDP